MNTMDKGCNGRLIFSVGVKGKFLHILRFPRFPWNRPGQQLEYDICLQFEYDGFID